MTQSHGHSCFFCHVAAALVVCDHCIEEKKTVRLEFVCGVWPFFIDLNEAQNEQ